MPTAKERQDLFDHWAANYDASVYADGEGDFPFAGYERVLDAIVQAVADEHRGVTLSQAEHGEIPRPRVLEVGIGTGNLAVKFSAMNWDVWGVDFSREMLQRAGERLPQARLVEADLLKPLPATLHVPFDHIVSAYVLHEFDGPTKMELLRSLAERSLAPGGSIVIGDIAFPTAAVRAGARERWQDVWDEDEFYWAAEESLAVFDELGWSATYEQVSVCAGVFVVRPGL